MGEGVGFVVKGDLKAHLGVVVGRPWHVRHDKDWLEPSHHPTARTTLDPLVSFPVQPIKAVVADLDLLMIVELDSVFHLSATRALSGHFERVVSPTANNLPTENLARLWREWLSMNERLFGITVTTAMSVDRF
jgi:hypothetical protein